MKKLFVVCLVVLFVSDAIAFSGFRTTLFCWISFFAQMASIATGFLAFKRE